MNELQRSARNRGLEEASRRFRLLSRRYFKNTFNLQEVLWILNDLKIPEPVHVNFTVRVIREGEDASSSSSPESEAVGRGG